MKQGMIKGWAWSGAMAAAAFFLAPEAHAVGWCPTAGNNIISCSSCSRELTCDVEGARIYITGNNVTLDGKGRYLRHAPGTGITVYGYASVLKNLNLDNPKGHGILISNDPARDISHWIDNVQMWNTAQVGFYILSANPVTITNSKVTGSGNTALVLLGSKYVDVKNCVITSSKSLGAYSKSSNSFILNNTFSDGQSHGFQVENVSGMVFSGNRFNNNQMLGLYMYNVGGTVRSNSGSGNRNTPGATSGNLDCYEYHDTPKTISSGSNVWGVYQGAGCNP